MKEEFHLKALDWLVLLLVISIPLALSVPAFMHFGR